MPAMATLAIQSRNILLFYRGMAPLRFDYFLAGGTWSGC